MIISNKTIGVIAGMGAAAGVKCYDLLVKECQKQGASKDSDFPKIIIYSMNSNAMDESGVVNEDQYKKDLLQAAWRLDSCNVDVLIIACNSAYAYWDDLSNVGIKILNMPELAARACSQKYGVVGSRTTKKYRLYPDAIQTTDDEQDNIDRIIKNAIAGRLTAKDHIDLFMTIKALGERGAKQVIIGCTELSLMNMSMSKDAEIIDSMQMTIKELFK
jgi:aspartate racemase